jgi:hypothetical protein
MTPKNEVIAQVDAFFFPTLIAKDELQVLPPSH